MTEPLTKNPMRVPVLLHGAPSGPTVSGPGVQILKVGDPTVATISKSGVYRTEAGEFFIGKEGDALPEGWTYDHPIDNVEDVDPTAVPKADGGNEEEERAKGAAPENKAKAGAPENRGR